MTSCRVIPSLSILNIWRRWGLTALLCLNRMPAYRLIASPQTSFEVRSSRIHLSPTDVGEKWMRDERTPKDVWGEANRLMTCVFCVSLRSAPLNKTIIVFASFFLAPAPGVHVVGSVKRNVGRKNSGGGEGLWETGENPSLSLFVSSARLVLLRCEKLLLFFIGLKSHVNSKYQSKGLTATSYICRLLVFFLLLLAFLIYVFWKLKKGFEKKYEMRDFREKGKILLKLWLIGKRTSCRPIRFVIILVIKQIGLPLRGRPILSITRMITNRIGPHSVLLPLLITFTFIAPFLLLSNCSLQWQQPHPQGFSLKKWVELQKAFSRSTHFLREKPWGRGCNNN